MMAFAVTQFPKIDIVKDDEYYVKWFAEKVTQVDGKFTYDEIPMHKCTPEDMKRFYEPSKASGGLVKQLQELDAFMCLDWRGTELAGEDPAINSKNIDVMLLPCNMKLGDFTEDHRIPENCNRDKEELIKYLGPIQMLVYRNIGSF